MGAVDPIRAADGDADGMHRDGVVAREIEEQLRGVRIRQKGLGMNLEPGGVGTRGHQLCEVRQP